MSKYADWQRWITSTEYCGPLSKNSKPPKTEIDRICAAHDNSYAQVPGSYYRWTPGDAIFLRRLQEARPANRREFFTRITAIRLFKLKRASTRPFSERELAEYDQAIKSHISEGAEIVESGQVPRSMEEKFQGFDTWKVIKKRRDPIGGSLPIYGPESVNDSLRKVSSLGNMPYDMHQLASTAVVTGGKHHHYNQGQDGSSNYREMQKAFKTGSTGPWKKYRQFGGFAIKGQQQNCYWKADNYGLKADLETIYDMMVVASPNPTTGNTEEHTISAASQGIKTNGIIWNTEVHYEIMNNENRVCKLHMFQCSPREDITRTPLESIGLGLDLLYDASNAASSGKEYEPFVMPWHSSTFNQQWKIVKHVSTMLSPGQITRWQVKTPNRFYRHEKSENKEENTGDQYLSDQTMSILFRIEGTPAHYASDGNQVLISDSQVDVIWKENMQFCHVDMTEIDRHYYLDNGVAPAAAEQTMEDADNEGGFTGVA